MIYDPVLKGLLSGLSPAGPKARLTILIFHRVMPNPDNLFPDEVDAERFDSIVSWLKHWFNVIPLSEAVDNLQQGSLPARAAAITFDDGYLDNHSQALPILARHNVPATFFVATGFLNGGRMWNDTVIESIRYAGTTSLDLSSIGLGTLPIESDLEKRSAIVKVIGRLKYLPVAQRKDLSDRVMGLADAHAPDSMVMMNDSHVIELRDAGMDIGAHTVDHPILAECDTAEAEMQIAESRDYLEGLLREPVTLFAYPNGKPAVDYLPEQARLVAKLGFKAAVSTAPGASRMGDDLFQLQRFTPWDRPRGRFGARLALNLRS